MLLMFAAGATGVMLGLWFRVHALIAASVAIVALCLLIAPFTELSLLSIAGMMLLLLSLLQAGYLAGLMVSRGRVPRGAPGATPARGRASRFVSLVSDGIQLASPRLRVSAARSSQMVQRRA